MCGLNIGFNAFHFSFTSSLFFFSRYTSMPASKHLSFWCTFGFIWLFMHWGFRSECKYIVIYLFYQFWWRTMTMPENSCFINKLTAFDLILCLFLKITTRPDNRHRLVLVVLSALVIVFVSQSIANGSVFLTRRGELQVYNMQIVIMCTNIPYFNNMTETHIWPLILDHQHNASFYKFIYDCDWFWLDIHLTWVYVFPNFEHCVTDT